MKVSYNKQLLLVAVDCLIFGYDGTNLKLLLIQRNLSPQPDNWSLICDFLKPLESLDQACTRMIQNLTGLKSVYVEQMHTFSNPSRNPIERTIATTYIILADMSKSPCHPSREYRMKWFSLNNLPKLIFDHDQMIQMGKNWLRYRATFHPILLELLPEKFTLQQLFSIYKILFEQELDQRNFSKKFLSSGLLIRLSEKEKENSRRGAFYYKLNPGKYREYLNKPKIIIHQSEYVDTLPMHLYAKKNLSNCYE